MFKFRYGDNETKYIDMQLEVSGYKSCNKVKIVQ